MFYNLWTLKQDYVSGSFTVFLDDTNMLDRKKSKKFSVVGGPGYAFIYFPRKDEKTNQKYREMLIKHCIKEQKDQIEQSTKMLVELEKLLSKN